MKTIKDICEARWDAWKSDCSGFLKAVAADVGIKLHGQANTIIDTMSDSWEDLGDDAAKAVLHASSRRLVVAGLKATGHGHVAVIVPGPATPWPHAYWGQFNGTGRKNATINWAWNKADRDDVRYYSRPIPSPIAIQ